jgi:hypothetical protein
LFFKFTDLYIEDYQVVLEMERSKKVVKEREGKNFNNFLKNKGVEI